MAWASLSTWTQSNQLSPTATSSFSSRSSCQPSWQLSSWPQYVLRKNRSMAATALTPSARSSASRSSVSARNAGRAIWATSRLSLTAHKSRNNLRRLSFRCYNSNAVAATCLHLPFAGQIVKRNCAILAQVFQTIDRVRAIFFDTVHSPTLCTRRHCALTTDDRRHHHR